jgi:hypothetical protein
MKASRDPAGSGEFSSGWTRLKGAGKTSSEVGTETPRETAKEALVRTTLRNAGPTVALAPMVGGKNAEESLLERAAYGSEAPVGKR